MLLQTFRTKVFLSLSDDFSAETASRLCGKEECLKPSYMLSETGQEAGVSVLTGKATSHRASLSTVRGGEAFDLLQAMNTGHQGTLSTLHANSGAETLTRLATCVMMSGMEYPHRTLRENIASALHLVVHIERREGRRLVHEIIRVKGYNLTSDRYDLETVYPGASR